MHKKRNEFMVGKATKRQVYDVWVLGFQPSGIDGSVKGNIQQKHKQASESLSFATKAMTIHSSMSTDSPSTRAHAESLTALIGLRAITMDCSIKLTP